MEEQLKESVLSQLQLRDGLKQADSGMLADMIEDCISELKEYINYRDTEALPDGCRSILKELVLIKYNQDGAEGIQSESLPSGNSTTYLTELPAGLKRRILKYRKMRR